MYVYTILHLSDCFGDTSLALTEYLSTNQEPCEEHFLVFDVEDGVSTVHYVVRGGRQFTFRRVRHLKLHL